MNEKKDVPVDLGISWDKFQAGRESMQGLRDMVASAAQTKGELDQLRRMVIAISRNLNTGDLPSELHDALDAYVAIIEPMYPDNPL